MIDYYLSHGPPSEIQKLPGIPQDFPCGHVPPHSQGCRWYKSQKIPNFSSHKTSIPPSMAKGSLTVRLVTTVAVICLGSLQFGYHMSELNSPEAILSCRVSIPGLVPYEESFFGSRGFRRCIELTSKEVGLVTSIFSIGGLIGSFYVGTVADAIGRKKTALLHNIIFLVGSCLNGISNSFHGLLFGRFVAGIGAGSALVVTSLVINEIAPQLQKGFLGSMNQVSVNIGILFTQVLALSWNNDNDWRLLLFMGAAIALVNFICILLYVDESPMWLFYNGMSPQAFTVLHKLRGGEYATARNEVNSWKNGDSLDEGSLLQEEDISEPSPSVKSNAITLLEYLKSPEYFNSRLVATGILVLQQFCGINSIIFYGVSVLISIFPSQAVFINCLISVVNAVVTFASAPLVDKLGRKPLLLTSVTFMGISSAVLGFGIISHNSLFSIVGTFTYITFFAIGLGPIPFLLVGEVTQPKAKALAQSWGVTMNWVATFIVGFSFPILKNSWIGGGVYYIFTGMCAFSYFFIKRCIPETKGKDTYEEVWR